MPTIASINTAVKTTLAAASGLIRSQDYNELTEGMQDYPTLQVIWQSGTTDARGQVDRSTFGGGQKEPIRQTDLTFHARVFGSARNELAEDQAAVIALASAVWDILDQQINPLYGHPDIKWHRWEAQNTVFRWGEQSIGYPGILFTIEIGVF